MVEPSTFGINVSAKLVNNVPTSDSVGVTTHPQYSHTPQYINLYLTTVVQLSQNTEKLVLSLPPSALVFSKTIWSDRTFYIFTCGFCNDKIRPFRSQKGPMFKWLKKWYIDRLISTQCVCMCVRLVDTGTNGLKPNTHQSLITVLWTHWSQCEVELKFIGSKPWWKWHQIISTNLPQCSRQKGCIFP